MPYTLTNAEGGQSFDLKAGASLVVGRALASDIPVFDPTISRRHAEVLCDETGVEVRDLGSSNGTFVNGTKVEQARLTPGDLVSFGKVSFRLTARSPTPAGASDSSGRRRARDSAGAAGGHTPAVTGPLARDGDQATPGGGSRRAGGTIVHQLRVPEPSAQG